MMRLESVLQWVGRTILVDTELAGRSMRAGQRVLLPLVSANHDEREFADPDRFDIACTMPRTPPGYEPGEQYNRPPMSKRLLTGKMREGNLRFRTFARLSMTLRLGHRAPWGSTPERRSLQLDSGEAVPSDGLIIATGVTARTLPTVPAHDERVATLRTLGAFRHFARHLRGARSIAVIGG